MKYDDINWKAFILLAEQLVGKLYVLGAETDLTDPNPDHINNLDCSELVEWLFSQIKMNDGTSARLYVPDGSYNQIKYVRPLSEGETILTGDLGFKAHPDNGVIHHVGVYLKDNDVLEAKGKKWGTIITPQKEFEASPDFLCWGRHKLIVS